MNKALKTLLVILCLSWFATAAQAYTTTTNYSFQLPQVNNAVDQNLWGSELNTNFSNLDSLLLTATNTLVATTLTTNATLTNANQNQLINANATSAPFTVTLQAAATAGTGFKVTIKKIDSSANAVTVKANASENIDAANTYVLTSQNQTITIVSDGTQWWVVVPVPPTVAVATSSSQGIVQPDNSTITISGGTLSAAKQGFTLRTPQSLSSGTTYTFTGIPSTAKQVTFSFNQVVFSGTAIPWLQLGTAGGIVSTGYHGAVSYLGSSAALSSAVAVATANVNGPFDGQITFNLMDATNHIWTFSGNVNNTGNNDVWYMGGSVAIPASLSQITITTAAGTATFSSGEMNISYQ